MCCSQRSERSGKAIPLVAILLVAILLVAKTSSIRIYTFAHNMGPKNCHNSGPRGSPDMILMAFDVKFDEKKDEIPPRACRP